jgi:hypothetical protein
MATDGSVRLKRGSARVHADLRAGAGDFDDLPIGGSLPPFGLRAGAAALLRR